jgi:hypothetical protein
MSPWTAFRPIIFGQAHAPLATAHRHPGYVMLCDQIMLLLFLLKSHYLDLPSLSNRACALATLQAIRCTSCLHFHAYSSQCHPTIHVLPLPVQRSTHVKHVPSAAFPSSNPGQTAYHTGWHHTACVVGLLSLWGTTVLAMLHP